MSFDVVKSIEFFQPPFQQLPQEVLDDDAFEDLPILGGILSDLKHAWQAKGSCLEIRNILTGRKIGSWIFGGILKDSNTRIVAVDEVKRSQGRLSLLVVGLECTISGGLICIFDIFGSKVLRVIQVKKQITSLHVIHSEDPVLSGPSPLKYFDGVIAIGTLGGNVFLLDMCQQICENALCNDNIATIRDELNPCQMTILRHDKIGSIKKYVEHAVENDDHLAVPLNVVINPSTEHFTLKGEKGEDRVHVDSSEAQVSSLFYSPQLASLLIGYNFGAFQLWDLRTLDLIYTSPVCEDHIPVTHFTVQEPADDPKAYCYIWVSYSHDILFHSGLPFAVMYSFYYDTKKYLSDYGYLYDDFQHCSIRFQLELGEAGMPTYKSRIKGGSCMGIHSLTKNPINKDLNSLSLCLISWFVWNTNREICTFILLFDLNQWYKEQMPNSPNWLECSNYLIKQTIESKFLDIRLDPKSLDQFIGVQRLEEHFCPTALTFDLWCLSENEVSKVLNKGLQKSFIDDIQKEGPLILLKPDDIFGQVISLGLTPLFCEMTSSLCEDMEYQREVLLSVALEQRLIGWLCECSFKLSTNSFSSSGLSLFNLTEWAFQRALTLKNACDSYCISLFDHSGSKLDNNIIAILNSSVSQIKDLCTLYNHIIVNLRRFVSETEHLAAEQYSLKNVVNYFEVLLWMVNIGLLPECNPEKVHYLDNNYWSAPYLAESLTEYYNKKRAHLQLVSHDTFVEKDCLLYIDNLINNSGSTVLRQQWQEDGGGGLYPAPSLQSVLRTYLLEGPDILFKHSLVTYTLLDIATTVDENNKIVKLLLKFPQIFDLTQSNIKIIQAFWHLDHDDYETALEYILDPCVLAEDLHKWHHSVMIRSLLMQEQFNLALVYLQIRKPSIQDEKDLFTVVSLLVSKNMLDEAFKFRQQHQIINEHALLKHIFSECNKSELLHSILYRCLNNEEEKAFFRYLQSTKSSRCEDLKVFYFILRSRFLEAFDSYSSTKRTKPENQGLIGQKDASTADNVIKMFKTLLPDVNRNLVELVIEQNEDQDEYCPSPCKKLKLSPRASKRSPTKSFSTSFHSKLSTPIVKRKKFSIEPKDSSSTSFPQSILKNSSKSVLDDSIFNETTSTNISAQIQCENSFRRSKLALMPRESISKTPQKSHVKFEDLRYSSSANTSTISNTTLASSANSSKRLSDNTASTNDDDIFLSPENSFEINNDKSFKIPEPVQERSKKSLTPVKEKLSFDEASPHTSPKPKKSDDSVESYLKLAENDLSSNRFTFQSPRSRRSYKRSFSGSPVPVRSSPRLAKKSNVLDQEDSDSESSLPASPVKSSLPVASEKLKGRRSLSRAVLENNAFSALQSLQDENKFKDKSYICSTSSLNDTDIGHSSNDFTSSLNDTDIGHSSNDSIDIFLEKYGSTLNADNSLNESSILTKKHGEIISKITESRSSEIRKETTISNLTKEIISTKEFKQEEYSKKTEEFSDASHKLDFLESNNKSLTEKNYEELDVEMEEAQDDKTEMLQQDEDLHERESVEQKEITIYDDLSSGSEDAREAIEKIKANTNNKTYTDISFSKSESFQVDREKHIDISVASHGNVTPEADKAFVNFDNDVIEIGSSSEDEKYSDSVKNMYSSSNSSSSYSSSDSSRNSVDNILEKYMNNEGEKEEEISKGTSNEGQSSDNDDNVFTDEKYYVNSDDNQEEQLVSSKEDVEQDIREADVAVKSLVEENVSVVSDNAEKDDLHSNVHVTEKYQTNTKLHEDSIKATKEHTKANSDCEENEMDTLVLLDDTVEKTNVDNNCAEHDMEDKSISAISEKLPAEEVLEDQKNTIDQSMQTTMVYKLNNEQDLNEIKDDSLEEEVFDDQKNTNNQSIQTTLVCKVDDEQHPEGEDSKEGNEEFETQNKSLQCTIAVRDNMQNEDGTPFALRTVKKTYSLRDKGSTKNLQTEESTEQDIPSTDGTPLVLKSVKKTYSRDSNLDATPKLAVSLIKRTYSKKSLMDQGEAAEFETKDQSKSSHDESELANQERPAVTSSASVLTEFPSSSTEYKKSESQETGGKSVGDSTVTSSQSSLHSDSSQTSSRRITRRMSQLNESQLDSTIGGDLEDKTVKSDIMETAVDVSKVPAETGENNEAETDKAGPSNVTKPSQSKIRLRRTPKPKVGSASLPKNVETSCDSTPNPKKRSRSASVDQPPVSSNRKRKTRSKSIDLDEIVQEESTAPGLKVLLTPIPEIPGPSTENEETQEDKKYRNKASSDVGAYTTSRRLTRKQASMLKSIGTVEKHIEKLPNLEEIDPIILMDKPNFEGQADLSEAQVYEPSVSSVGSDLPRHTRSASVASDIHAPSTPKKKPKSPKSSLESTITNIKSRLRRQSTDTASVGSEQSDSPSPSKRGKKTEKASMKDEEQSKKVAAKRGRSRSSSVSSVKSHRSDKTDGSAKGRSRRIQSAKSELPEIQEEKSSVEDDSEKKKTRKRKH
ncbi:protein ELYS isoform X2 [Sitophilus oryzae]|uniref:Protein ELYS isoform X2 n=1 Tax=Sitophilus oryzae TaxID=7048 RepID=A0A6J2X6C6_SITOR|nr:protein ELYS isoform X2 [Sitophilus oryzae]